MKRTKQPKRKRLKVKVQRQQVKKHHQLIAVNLKDTMKEIEQNPPDIPGFTISRLEYLINLIITRKQKKHQGSWSVLNMKYMNNIVPQASQYLHFLRDKGIIEWQGYSAGRNSRLYRLINEGWTEQQPITDNKIIRRIEKNKSHFSRRNSKKYPYLNRSIRKVELDFEAARQAIDEQYHKDIKAGTEQDTAEARRNYALGAIIRIQAEEIYYQVNDTNGRLDSNYTNLPGYLMKYLSVDGQPFIEMDISNAQPYFAAALFFPTKEIQDLMEQYLPRSITKSVKPLLDTDSQDVTLYRSLVSDGKFYEYMAEQFKEHEIEFAGRKDLKRQMFVVFFGKRYAYKWEPAARVFKTVFPNVHKVFYLIKKKKYNQLAVFLQRIESYTMLERVVKEVENELPELNLLTKHDSILPVKFMVPNKPYIETVRRIIVQTVKEVTGIKPQGRMTKLRT